MWVGGGLCDYRISSLALAKSLTNGFFCLTLHEAASEMHLKRQGGAYSPAPIKTSLEAILTQIFHITWIWGQK